MLPGNDALRAQHAPLKEWVTATCKTPLLYKPGTDVRYQSMGFLLAGEIVELVSENPAAGLPAYRGVPAAGHDADLTRPGWTQDLRYRALPVSGHDDWNWNSPYWRNLGAPWGGAHASAADVARFARAFLAPIAGVLKAQTAAAMIVNQNGGLKLPWGLGWQVEPRKFGKACSAKTFGHGGSTEPWCGPIRKNI
jgi:CubicO group peptidase (beta-lactamase class C family)